MSAGTTHLADCVECGKAITLSPPLNQRQMSWGVPMTRADAMFLFVEGKAGRCTECYVAYRGRPSTAARATTP